VGEATNFLKFKEESKMIAPYETDDIKETDSYQTALNTILTELNRQYKKKGANILHDLEWQAVVSEELGEAAKEVLIRLGDKELETSVVLDAEIAQIAVAAFAWLECRYRKLAIRKAHE
jgi:hypothetical protein